MHGSDQVFVDRCLRLESIVSVIDYHAPTIFCVAAVSASLPPQLSPASHTLNPCSALYTNFYQVG